LSVPQSSDTGSVCRVERELPDRDAHAAGTEVAKTQDPFVVGGDDEPDTGAVHVVQQLSDASGVVRRHPQPAGAPQDVAELAARLTDRRRIHDRSELVQVVDQQPMEERLVAVLQSGQPDVPLQVVGLATQVFQLQGHLVLDRRHAEGQQTPQRHPVALGMREGGVPVQARLGDECVASVLAGHLPTVANARPGR
jgi:hypothetical protein